MSAVPTPGADVADTAERIQIEHPFLETARMFSRNWAAMFGLMLLLSIVLTSIFGPMLYPTDPFELVWAPLSPPGEGGFLLGTDTLGRDLLAGIIYGSRATLAVGAAAALITIVIGVLVGALAGYYRGWVEEALMRMTEFFQVLPPLLLAMVVIMLFKPTLFNIAVTIGIVSWTGTARMARAEFLRIRELEYVKAERAIGSRDARIIWQVMLPNAGPPLIVGAALSVGTAILFEAGLSFLGLADPNIMTWGYLIGINRPHILEVWWPVTFPGIAIFTTVLAVALVGDGLNDALNPKLRQR